MRQYLSSVAKKDAKVLVENTYYDISSIMRDTVTDLLPTHELEVDERLVHLYLKSVRIIKFASEALKAEIRAKKIMRCLRRRKLTIERGINIVPPETPLYVETHETVETLRHLLPLKVNMNEIEMEETLIRESSLKQLKKDIERDRLIVNGKTINGSISKLEGCFSSIGDAMDNVLIECNLPLLSREGKELLTFCALRNIARTHSGGVTFQALQATLDINSTIIVPLSASALPLRILVAVGSFPKKSIRPLGIQTETDSEDDEEAGEVEEKDKVGPLQDWGLKCFIQATTVFNLKAVANASDENIDASQTDLKVRAVYDDAYYISINPKASEISLDEVASCIASSFSGGKVTILPCPQDGDEHLLKTS